MKITNFGVYAIAYIGGYGLVFVFFTLFYGRIQRLPFGRAIYSLFLVISMLAIVFLLIPVLGHWWGNRLEHILGGGALAYFMCWRIVDDAELPTNAIQRVILCFLTVTALGVGNELFESLIQATTGAVLSPTTTDTWWDLWSNTVGAVLAALLLRPNST